MAQIVGEQHYRPLARAVEHIGSYFTLDRRRDKPVVRVKHGSLDVLSRRAVVFGDEFIEHVVQDHVLRRLYRNLEEFLFFTAVYRKDPVIGDLVQLFLIIVVLRVDGILFLVLL